MSLIQTKIEPTVGQTPIPAAADTGALAPAIQKPMLCVSIHDVAPATWPDCLRLVQAVREVADIPLTWLVVPHYHFRPERSPVMEACLDVVVERGDELALHGYSHLDTEANGGGLAKRFLRTVYTRKEGEFAALAEAEARRRLELGLAWFAEHGWPTHGFVPPAWLLGKGSWNALRASPFAYTTTFSHFHCLRDADGNPIRHSVLSPSLVYAARNRGGRLLSPRVADATAKMLEKSPLLRFSLHPPDGRYPDLVGHMQRTLERLLVQREAVTKEECARRLVQAYEARSARVAAGPAAADLVIVQDIVAPVRATPVDAAPVDAAPADADKPADAEIRADAHAAQSRLGDEDAGAVRTDAATAEAATAEAAMSDAAATDAAATDAAATDAEKTGAAMADAAATDAEKTEAATTYAAATDAEKPEAATTYAAATDAATAEAATAEAATAEAATSAITQPQGVQPEAARPEVARREAAQAEASQAEATQVDATKPEAGRRKAAHVDDARADEYADACLDTRADVAQSHARGRDPAPVPSTHALARQIEDVRLATARAIDARAIDRHIADAHAMKKHVAKTYGADAAVMPKPAVPGTRPVNKPGKRVVRTSAHESVAMQRAAAASSSGAASGSGSGSVSGSHAAPGRQERVDFGNRQAIVPTFVTSTDPTSRRASDRRRSRRSSADKGRSVPRPPSR
ncbi:DUF2334 domain-containing protein [Massilia sp. TN1-12]|uniref:DUF2334 domain-containing protein n=1 Tax=Massilia paldalensis TaxID=3377675 RepID=UPI00384FA9C6